MNISYHEKLLDVKFIFRLPGDFHRRSNAAIAACGESENIRETHNRISAANQGYYLLVSSSFFFFLAYYLWFDKFLFYILFPFLFFSSEKGKMFEEKGKFKEDLVNYQFGL